MLAVNKITGMQFFEVTEAEAADQAAAKEIMISRKAGPDFIVDVHTHICTRKDGYIPGVNTTKKGNVVCAAARRPRQGPGPAERNQRHDCRELREADPRGKRHQRCDLQS